ncbi:MAG: hypothetical protein GWN30_31555, partial [Gammaproteobacteria bacterium]|nr:hypothetical protein [Gammaproteobacteria bacterium]NIW97943.1 hypothetical protein [Phycisphaerae bacterium]
MRRLLKLSSRLLVINLLATLSYAQTQDTFPRVMIVSGNVQLSVGDSVQNVAVFQDTGGVEMDTTFNWSVKPDSLGKFNPTGLFTTTHEGEGYIFVSLDTLVDSVMVEVKATDEDDKQPSVGGEFFIVPGDTIIQIGTALQFTAHFRDTSGVVTDTSAQWSLKGQPVGTISDSGLLNAYSPGVVLVKAFLGNREQTAMVTAV